MAVDFAALQRDLVRTLSGNVEQARAAVGCRRDFMIAICSEMLHAALDSVS